MKNKLARYGKVACISLALIATERFCHKKTRGFRPHKIYSSFSFDPSFELEKLTFEKKELVQRVLSQPFTYLGDGGQGYSFVSQDGNYVLKFFKLHHVTVYDVIRNLSLPGALGVLKDEWIAGRDKDKERMLSSCKIAYERLPKETGMLYAHINQTTNEHPTITLYDAIGAVHHIDLDKAVFALQKKATLAFTHLKEDLLQKDEIAAKGAIDDFLYFVTQRSKKGVEDRDSGLKRNFGYIDGHLMEIDVGSFVLNEDIASGIMLRNEVAKKGEDLRILLAEKYPELLPYYDARLYQLTASIEASL